ncbi:MAG: hypothetical protein K8S27_01745, partial [Candidatus Omnitrophica bacterium]|nr:hypothetical protein [Candidatus Omnitrophota bacterium]
MFINFKRQIFILIFSLFCLCAFASPVFAQSYILAEIQAPTPGSTINTKIVTFTWDTGTGVTSYALALGTTVGDDDILNSGVLSATSYTYNYIPLDGQTLYVRLYSVIAGQWEYNDYTFNRANIPDAPAAMQSPAPGATLSQSETFTWDTGTGVSAYWLSVGTGVGGTQYHSSGQTTSTSRTVNNLPLNASTLYVRLSSIMAGQWHHVDYTYTAGGQVPVKAVLQLPTAGTLIDTKSVTFTWDTGTGVTSYALALGTTVG